VTRRQGALIDMVVAAKVMHAQRQFKDTKTMLNALSTVEHLISNDYAPTMI